MAKKGSGGGNIRLVLALVIIGIVITLISNIFNFPILITHGPTQYISNIWQGHHDFYGQAKTNYKVYEKILTVAELEKEIPKATIKKGYAFKFKGYVQKGSLTWLAVKVFNGSTAINGYFVIEEKSGDSTFWNAVPFNSGDSINNKYFREISDQELNKVREYYKSLFVEKVYERIDVKETSGNLNVQKIEESETYKIIPYISTEKKAFYCTNKEHEIVEDLDNRLLGDNFETNFLQTDQGYDIFYSEVSKEGILEKVISKWYFKIGFPIFLLIFLKSLLGATFTVTPKCPECGSKDFSLVEKQLIAENYKYEKKNGERDRRYKNNPLVSTYNLYFECSECPHSWDCEETDATNENKTGNIKTSRKRKAKRLEEPHPPSTEVQNSIPPLPANPDSDSDVLMNLMSQFEQGLIDEKEFRQKQAMLMSRINPVDTGKQEIRSVRRKNYDHQKETTKILIIEGDMTVDELKSSFENSSGINIRIYNGKKFADGSSALYSIGYKYPKPVKLKLNEKMLVGSLEKAFKKKLGLSIQIENRKGKLADNSLSLFQV